MSIRRYQTRSEKEQSNGKEQSRQWWLKMLG
jgi:hypothetical protein